MLYSVQLFGGESQIIRYEGTLRQLIEELDAARWYYCKNWDDAAIALHTMNGDFVTSVTEINESVLEQEKAA